MPQLKANYSQDTRTVSKNNNNNNQIRQSEEETKYMKTNTRLQKRSYDENGDFTVERDQNVSGTFNYEKRAIEDGGVCASARLDIISLRPELDHILIGDKINGARDFSLEHTYENINFKLNGSGSRELLLHKFFPNKERGDAIYENLCRGCGYGVFAAYGEFCYFCSSIVNGVDETAASIGSLSAEHLESVNSNGLNVYENICENCYAIYSSDECVNCEPTKLKKSTYFDEKSEEIVGRNKKKIGQSKSFNKKHEKRSIFQGFFGSLKRSPKSTKKGNSNSAGRLEIIHNVDGYENVFRTQESFDLQRICELKRTLSSNSEQHIYGRLRCAEVERSQSNSTLPLYQYKQQFSQCDSPTITTTTTSGYSNSPSVTVSQSSLLNGGEELSNFIKKEKKSTIKTAKELVAKAYKSGKRPRISKPRLLRAITSEENRIPQKSKAAVEKQQAIYLPDSVCDWMRSLRVEIHNYYSCFGDDETIGLCSPKSIPAKNSLLTYKQKVCGNFVDVALVSGDLSPIVNNIGAENDFATLLTYALTNNSNIEQTISKVRNEEINKELLHSKNSFNSDISNRSSESDSTSNYDETVTLREKTHEMFNSNDNIDSPVALTQMVNEFKRNLVKKQYKKKMSKEMTLQHTQQQEGICENDTEKSKKVNSLATNEHEIFDSFKKELRARRQGIYLKVDECKVHEDDYERDQSENNKNNNNENANNNHHNCCLNNNSNVEKDSIIKTTELDSTNFGESPVSRRRAVQAHVSCNGDTLNNNYNSINNRKRCGIYEPNVVCDILSEFDTFLQHEEDSIIAYEFNGIEGDKSTLETSQQTEDKEYCNDSALSVEQPNDPTFITESSSLSVLSQSDLTPYAAQRDQHHYHQYQQHHQHLDCSTTGSIEQIFNVLKLGENLHLSRGLNRIIINYQQPLRAFLLAIRVRHPRAYRHCTQAHLIKKYWRFHAYCIKKSSVKFKAKKCIKRNSETNHNRMNDATNTNEIEKFKAILRPTQSENVSQMMAASADDECAVKSERNSVKIIVQQLEVNYGERVTKSTTKVEREIKEKSEVLENRLENSSATNEVENLTSVENIEGTNLMKSNEIPLKPHRTAPKKPEPPQVPLRDPKTSLSNKSTPPLPKKRESPNNIHNKMTIPTISNSNSNNRQMQATTSTSNESIYQPIWKFQTVGEVQERYQTDADYYEIGDETKTGLNKQGKDDDADSFTAVLNANNVEDHGEWETDDEFMFTTEMMMSEGKRSPELNSLNSSSSALQSNSGSTVAGFSSSTATLASAISSSLTHHLLRNIGIFYSLTEPKLRAIIYDYDRVHASVYFAKRNNQQQMPSWESPTCTFDSMESSNANDSGIGKSPSQGERSPIPPPRTTSAAAKSPASLRNKFSESGCQSTKVPTMSSQPLLPDSVQAWKFMLLDVNYLEDEEDMIVSEEEILRSQNCKEDNDARQTQQLNILQRFKSASFGNLVDLPNEEDKKSIAERMRNKLQRGVFKLNVRSPKSDKKNRGVFRRAEATSLYLEDGMKPKYPIFGAPLNQLELDECIHLNVPRFVVDCVAYIERKDCIQQEGLYRASGNKVSIEELKQKLSESYIYDPKLLVIDDIHTLTSLLKLFFRELGAPLIPQETYERLGRNLSDAAAIETMRDAFEEMREPNRSTLKFLIRHLTNVAACSYENRMPASNLAIVWGPCIMSANQIEFDIGRMNTLAKVLIENYARIFNESERLVA